MNIPRYSARCVYIEYHAVFDATKRISHVVRFSAGDEHRSICGLVAPYPYPMLEGAVQYCEECERLLAGALREEETP
jgi:hypothetical protein